MTTIPAATTTTAAVTTTSILINTSEELTQLLATHDKVVVDFFAPWVAAAKQTAPLFEHLASTYAERGIMFAKVDVDENEECAEEFGVSTIPSFLLFHKAVKHSAVIGAHAEELTAAVEQFAEPPAEDAKAVQASASDASLDHPASG